MKHGDLSNRVSPRVLLVFEGSLGYLEDKDRKAYMKFAGRGRWYRAVRLWKLDEMYVRQILYLYWKLDYNVEIVTFLGDSFAAELSDYLADEQVVVHNVWASTPTLLARKIAFMPDLSRVYDPDPERWLTYGGKGTYIRSHTQLGV
jgi:hypothetical protein